MKQTKACKCFHYYYYPKEGIKFPPFKVEILYNRGISVEIMNMSIIIGYYSPIMMIVSLIT